MSKRPGRWWWLLWYGPYALNRATRLRRLRCLFVPKRRHRRQAGD